jgi:hypothetical protein
MLDTYVVIGADLSAVPVDVTPTVWQELDQLFITPGEGTENKPV